MADAGKRRRLLVRWASVIMIVLGAGHLALVAVTAWEDVARWVGEGLWAAVPLSFADQAVGSMANKLTFWAGPGSFSVPLILLGGLTWHYAGRDVVVPAAVGWGLAVWCAVGGVLLVPSPFFAGVIAGALIVVAARRPVSQPVG